MDTIPEGCRLCLDLFAECFTTIENPLLKDQMKAVFRFSIEHKLGYPSGVCHSCSYAIAEFYQYSEKVRQNQEVLDGNVTAFDSMGKTLKSVKVETSSDSELPETTEDASKSKNVVFGEVSNHGYDELYEHSPKKSSGITEDSYEPEDGHLILDSEITTENVKVETNSDCEFSETTRGACELNDQISGDEEVTNSSDDEPLKNLRTKRPGRSKNDDMEADDQLFNKHFSIKVEPLSDSGFPEMIRNACEWKQTLSTEEVVPSSGADKLYEPAPKMSRTELTGRLERADKPKEKFKQTRQQQYEEDLLFNKHFSMICDVCGTSVATFTELLSHFRKEHEPRLAYLVCCNKKLFQRRAIRDHIKFHTNPNMFRCELCGYKYKGKDILNAHMVKIHSSKGQGFFKCNHCPQSFVQKFALAYHMKQHVKVKIDADEQVPNSCNDDERKKPPKMNRTSDYLEEEDQLFNKHFRMVCDLCGTSAATFAELYRHSMKEHNRRAYVVCCNKKLDKRYLIREHIEFHNDPDAFRCQICGTKCKSKDILNTHMLGKHSSDDRGPFTCDQCPQSFVRKSALTRHLKWHVKVMCPKCGKMYVSTSSLNEHMKKRHADT